MAKTISEEELQLRKRARRRLIGAIALVLIVAIFVPMVLDHEPKPAEQDLTVQIPSSDSGAFTSKVVPRTGSSSSPKPSAKTSAAPAGKAPGRTDVENPSRVASNPPPYDTEAAPPKKAAEPPKPAVKPAVERATRENTAPAPAAEGKSDFVVQVAALSDAAKAKQMQEQMSAEGIKSYTEAVPTNKGTVTRVRAGPFTSREEAEKMRDKLKALGLSGNVVPRRS
jgi:DedD protein